MGAAYATIVDLASAIDLSELAQLATPVNAGDVQLTTDRPVSLAAGACLLVGYRGQVGETATVSAVSSDGTSVTLAGPLMQTHPAGTWLLDATPFPSVLEAASRLVDQLTYTPAGGWAFADRVTVTRGAKVGRDGTTMVSLDHTPVQQVHAVTVQASPLEPVWDIPASQVWWDDEAYVVAVHLGDLSELLALRPVRMTITYSGGYTADEMPADIKRATAILAARLWKEKDSGYSDVIGNTDFGLLQYTQAAPKDVLAMLQPRRRVGV